MPAPSAARHAIQPTAHVAAPPGALRARAIGCALLAAAAAAGWFFVLRPLGLAEAGADAARIGIERKAFLFVPLAALAGLVLLCGGARVLPLLGRPPRGGREGAAVLALLAVAAALGGAGWWWTEARLHALGFVLR